MHAKGGISLVIVVLLHLSVKLVTFNLCIGLVIMDTVQLHCTVL